MQLYQPEKGYCFNSDTLFLYAFAKNFFTKGKVLEVGSGSGVLGLLLARDLSIELTQVEKQETFAKFSLKNAQTNEIKSTVIHQDFLEYQSQDKFDVIVSNPPFYHGGVVQSDDEMRQMARYNEHLPIEDFIAKVTKTLTPRGRFIFCYDPQLVQRLLAVLEQEKLTLEDMRFVYPKAGKMATLVMIHARKSSKSVAKNHPPLFAFEGDAHSSEAKAIYKMAKTHSIKCEIN